MADTAARIAGLGSTAVRAAAAVAARLAAVRVVVRALRAVAGNVADLAALVALSTRLAATGGSTAGAGAVTGDVASLAAPVARLGILRTLRAITACQSWLVLNPYTCSLRLNRAVIEKAYSCDPRRHSCS